MLLTFPKALDMTERVIIFATFWPLIGNFRCSESPWLQPSTQFRCILPIEWNEMFLTKVICRLQDPMKSSDCPCQLLSRSYTRKDSVVWKRAKPFNPAFILKPESFSFHSSSRPVSSRPVPSRPFLLALWNDLACFSNSLRTFRNQKSSLKLWN